VFPVSRLSYTCERKPETGNTAHSAFTLDFCERNSLKQCATAHRERSSRRRAANSLASRRRKAAPPGRVSPTSTRSARHVEPRSGTPGTPARSLYARLTESLDPGRTCLTPQQSSRDAPEPLTQGVSPAGIEELENIARPRPQPKIVLDWGGGVVATVGGGSGWPRRLET
jgi:hypothetical protein